MANVREEARDRRKKRIRQKVHGTTERPRLTVFRSLRHIYAQVIDDDENKVLAAASTWNKASASEGASEKKTQQAKKVGARIATLCKERGIDKVVFDRNGYRYHGRVLALAAAAREAGLVF